MGSALQPPFLKASTSIGKSTIGRRVFTVSWVSYAVLGSLWLFIAIADIATYASHRRTPIAIAFPAIMSGFWTVLGLAKRHQAKRADGICP